MNARPNIVYVVKPADLDGPYKIGSTSNLERRLRHIANASPVAMELVCSMPGDRALESRIHHRLIASHLRCEWFAPSAETLAVVSEISAGTLDVDALPAPRGVTGFVNGRPARAA